MGLWLPTTEAELLEGLTLGLIPEGHFIDFKRELGATPGARKETAQDIASFAIDGGVLVVGVAEENGRFEPTPLPVSNLSERAEQIAQNRPDPGLSVRTHIISAAADQSLGYLVVHVPASPGAPHMVDGRYWGRSERTKRPLSNDEVVRLHGRRTNETAELDRALRIEQERQPQPVIGARMFLIAHPLHAAPHAGRAYARGKPAALRGLLAEGENAIPESARGSYPTSDEVHRFERRANGIAATNLGPGRAGLEEWSAREALDVEVHYTGDIRAVISFLSVVEEHHRVPEGIALFRDAAALAWSHRLIAWARLIGDRIAYNGAWGFGVLLTGLTGTRAMPPMYDEGRLRLPLGASIAHAPVYDADEFRGIAIANRVEIDDEPSAIVDRMTGDLLHSFGSADRFPDALVSAVS